ncbi:unnamed protein product [Notodromas monacha]|uniref:Sialin n=1 Tax=Notodromas monacha TaxID=399045 RepID=A0A7R9BFI0_9CRUS|nr:unnamed protein product [Notodromas monacha]CAG0913241.1 unnamed protein product [Notodromas monacha]
MEGPDENPSDERDVHTPRSEVPEVTDTNEKPRKPGCSARITFITMASLGFFNVYAMRANLSIAIISMVQPRGAAENHTAVCSFGKLRNKSDEVDVKAAEGEFDWDEVTQGLILGSFFWGYMITQIPGGILVKRYGSKWVLGIGCLLAAVVSVLTPTAARHSVFMLMAARVCEGLAEGVTFPAMHSLIAKWAPPAQRSTFSAIIYGGATGGLVFSMPVSGLLASSSVLGGWPSIFYVFGLLGVTWFIFWTILVYEDPESHPWISSSERNYIKDSIGTQMRTHSEMKKHAVPYRRIFTSMPFWAIVVGHSGQNWGFYTILTQLPNYLKNVMGYDVRTSGIISAVPYLTMYITGIVGSFVADGFTISGLSLLTIAHIGCHLWATVVFFTIGVGAIGMKHSGYGVNHIDISPNFAGILIGFTNFAATIPGFVAPYVTGIITEDDETIENWATVFLICAAVFILSALFYGIFASGEEQEWNRCGTDVHEGAVIVDSTKRQESEEKTGAVLLATGEALVVNLMELRMPDSSVFVSDRGVRYREIRSDGITAANLCIVLRVIEPHCFCGMNQVQKMEPEEVFHMTDETLGRPAFYRIPKTIGNPKSKRDSKNAKKDPFTGRAPVSKHLLEKHKKPTVEMRGLHVPGRVRKAKIAQNQKKIKFVSEQAARSELLLTETAGSVDVDSDEESFTVHQSDIKKAVDITSAKKAFDLDLTHFGPYRMCFSRNGRYLLLGGRKAHVAALDWVTKELKCEINVMETVHDVRWLHNETMFAVAQKDHVYMYDNVGVELHCVKRLHRCVSFWSPCVNEALAVVLVSPQPIKDIAIDHTGTYLATSSSDNIMRIWDVRTFGILHSYKLPVAPRNLAFSQKGLLACSAGNVVDIYKDCCTEKAETPYLRHRVHRTINQLEFPPFEDVLGITHFGGFSSILVPGAGEANFDAYENNPFQSKKQRQEAEVKALLEKIQPELITLDPAQVMKVDTDSLRQNLEEKRKIAYVRPREVEFEPRKKAKSKGGSAKRTKVKSGVKEQDKLMLLKEAKRLEKKSVEKKETVEKKKPMSFLLKLGNRSKFGFCVFGTIIAKYYLTTNNHTLKIVVIYRASTATKSSSGEAVRKHPFQMDVRENDSCLLLSTSQAVVAYPLIAKTLRDHFSKEPKKPQDTGCHHRCGMSFFAQKQSTGYDDLDELTQSPKDLKFTFEILKIETDLDYEKEGWIMTDEEKSNSIAGLRDKGNTLYKSGDIGGAAAVYSEALTRLDALSIKEKPGDEGFLELERKKLPFLLNLAQCKLIQKEYYPAIELCGMAINIDPKNVKAHFRRGKAHMGAWNLKEARDDFRKAEEMDSNMSATIKQLLAQTSQLEKEKNEEDRRKLGGLFTKT